MKRLWAALAAISATLAATGGAAADLSVGVNDDASKSPEVAPWFYSTMQSVGLSINTLTLRWDETAPTEIAGAGLIDQAIEQADADGVTIELDLYPLRSTAFTDGRRCAVSRDPESCGDTFRIQQFAEWAASVAARFPTVSQFVVMNECNQPRFVNPQWDRFGNNQSAEICGRALAAAYDAIKAVSSSDTVWGVGLSPRGNDSPNARSNSSTKPVTFLAALGWWFRAFALKTHRTRPLMDGFDFHPYPVPQTQPFARGYADPKEASVANLSRIYQAFYSAFNGTRQKTIGQQPGGGLLISLNETGVQTASGGRAAYTGSEVSATSAGGVVGKFATEDYQARWYRLTLDLLACDPNVAFVNIFHLVDDDALEGWQSGLYYADETAKRSAQTVQAWLARTGGACMGTVHPWTPSGAVFEPPKQTAKARPTVKPKRRAAVQGKPSGRWRPPLDNRTRVR